MSYNLNKNAFVFSVCGRAKFIRELTLSLAALQRHSKTDIFVVTDNRRNEIPITWHNVLHVDTPENFNHHQASIYLKTSLHRILPAGPRYCYLDSDIFAVASTVDDIFSAASTPVSFAADLSLLHQFSPYAVNCQCMQKNATEREEIQAFLKQAYHLFSNHKAGWQRTDYEQNAKRRLVRAAAYLSNRLLPRSASQRGEPRQRIWSSFWYESKNETLHTSRDIVRFIESSSAWRRDKRRQSWISPTGNDVYHLRCNHLIESIWNTFFIHIGQSSWQHWNGGVFLFDQRAHAFLDAWHNKTMHIFNLPDWRTRDQGTLVATVWEFGLQDQPVLPGRFNCILDANSGATMISTAGDYLTTDAFLTTTAPVLAHVLSRVGDSSWDVWRWVHAHAFQDE